MSCLAANAGVLPASKSPARVQPHGQSVPPTEGFARSDRGARSGTKARERSQGERGIPEPRSGEDMPRKPLDGVERQHLPARETAARFPLPHGECGGWCGGGSAPYPRLVFGDAARPPFFSKKGEEGWGTGAATGRGNAPGKEGRDPTRSTP